MHTCPVFGKTCCQNPIRPMTFPRDIIDPLYQGGPIQPAKLMYFLFQIERAARAQSTLRPLYISCLRT